jgi:hypothetical protein
MSAAKAGSDKDLEAALCTGRPHCQIRARRDVKGAQSTQLVELSIKRAPDAPKDDDEICDIGEYWLITESRPAVLIAQDCDQQMGPDGVAHADIRLDGTELSLAYVEKQAGDRCEGQDARLQLVPLKVEHEEIWNGRRESGRCLRDNAVTFDWAKSEYSSMWQRARCNAADAFKAQRGATIPSFPAGAAADTARANLKACAALVDAARTTKWFKSSADPKLRLSAAVIDSVLNILIEGTSPATLRVFTAPSTAGDGPLGDLGCEPETQRPISTWTIKVSDALLETAPQSPTNAKLVSRDSNITHLQIQVPPQTARMALSLEDASGAKLQSAQLSAKISSALLPPLTVIQSADVRCGVDSAGSKAPSTSPSRTPLLTLGRR